MRNESHFAMKKFLAIAVLLSAFQVKAQIRIEANEAMATAEVFLKQQHKQESPALSLNETIRSEVTDDDNLFVFSVKPNGFVIVSATNEVLAYSLTSDLPKRASLPDHIAYWLDLYNTQTDYWIEHPDSTTKQRTQYQEVEPLVTSVWGQGCWHNQLCPEDENGPCSHVSAGCVAIAMAQIMHYHKQPETGQGSMSYSCAPYGVLSAYFGGTIYDWEAMADTLHEQNLNVARLVSHCGIAVRMQYGPHLSLASNTDALTAFRMFFSYPQATQSKRSDFDDEEWTQLILNDLNLRRPVYYAGVAEVGGHAFVCDGYDGNGLFHFNFGWDGVADGYYTLDAPDGFSMRQAVIRNLYPVSNIPISADEHGIIYVAPDGNGNGSSWQQATSELQLAIFKAQTDFSRIWVKEGCYMGDSINDYAFIIHRKCSIYGGFKGDEPYDYDLTLRDFEAHPTLLDGNHHQGVVYVVSDVPNDNIIIDGFTVQNGNANIGAGMFLRGNVKVKNCKICHNRTLTNGGGIYQRDYDSNEVLFENCEIYGNEAKQGGGIYDYGYATYRHCQIHNNIAFQNGGGINCGSNGSSQFINCTISNNTALKGGGVNSGSVGQSHFINCTISNNMASDGGGINSHNSNAYYWNCLINNNTAQIGGGCYLLNNNNLYNCTIVKNVAQNDFGGVFTSQSTIENNIQNCIIWGNESANGDAQIGPDMNYKQCAVENDASVMANNFKAQSDNDGESPGFYVRFIDPDVVVGVEGHGGDWRLQPSSPCIDRVRSIELQPGTDLAGNPRLRHSMVDLGAYESNTVAHTINLNFCETAPYYYNRIYIPSIGTYTFLYPNETYDSLVILNMIEQTIQLRKEICETETYDFFGEQLNQPGHYSTFHNCKMYELDLAFRPITFGDFQQVEICEGETYDFFGSSIREPGHYSAIHDCKTYDLDLSLKSAQLLTAEETICEGETYYFIGTPLTQSGFYTNHIDCTDYQLLLNVTPKLRLVHSNDTTVEYGHPIKLFAAGADSYLWSTGATTDSITIYPTESQFVSVTGFKGDECSNQARILVTVKQQEEKTVMFPNPAGNTVEIYMPLIDEVIVFNMFGEPIEQVAAHRQAVKLNVGNYPNGIYIVCVRQLSKHYYNKLVIRH